VGVFNAAREAERAMSNSGLRPGGRLSPEFKVVIVMALGFGLVGIDRFLIATMFPVIARDLRLSYGDIGIITGALALAWGASALFTGNASDRIGRRTVLCGSMVVFALLIGGSGLAAGLGGLVAVRILMGLADGAYTPTSIAVAGGGICSGMPFGPRAGAAGGVSPAGRGGAPGPLRMVPLAMAR